MTEITDEMVEKARNAMQYDYPSRADMRAALEAVAPALRAQGMRKAVQVVEEQYFGGDFIRCAETIDLCARAILARAAELEKATP